MARKKTQTVQLKVRMKEPLRAKIEKASKARGVSMNMEIVALLEQAFRDREALYREFGGEKGYNVMRWLALTFRLAQQMTGKPWVSDPEPFLIGLEAWKLIREKGVPEKDLPSEESLRDMGVLIAESLGRRATRIPERTE